MEGRDSHEQEGTFKSEGCVHPGGVLMAKWCVHMHSSQKCMQFIIRQLCLKKAV